MILSRWGVGVEQVWLTNRGGGVIIHNISVRFVNVHGNAAAPLNKT